MAGPGGGPPRKSHTKSRKGCKTCKRRHIRCDETFPQCRNCTKHNCRCDYMDSPAASEDRPTSPRDPDLLVTPEIQQEVEAWHSSGIPTFPELQMSSPSYWKSFKIRDLRLVHHIAGISIDMHRRGYSGCAIWIQKMPTVLTIAMSTDYVMSAVFALSAAHLAWETGNPETESLFFYHRGVALKGLHDAIGAFSRENSDGILAASLLLSSLTKEWRSWASLQQGISSVLNSMQPWWKQESELAAFLEEQRLMRQAQTPVTPNFPTSNSGQVAVNIARLDQVRAALRTTLQRVPNHPVFTNKILELEKYLQNFRADFPVQSPEDAFARLQEFRNWLLWLPPTLLREDSSDSLAQAILAQFYGTALALEPLFPEIGGAYLGSVVVLPLKEAHRLITKKPSDPYMGDIHFAVDMIDWPVRLLAEYENRDGLAGSPLGSYRSVSQEPTYTVPNTSIATDPDYSHYGAYTASAIPAPSSLRLPTSPYHATTSAEVIQRQHSPYLHPSPAYAHSPMGSTVSSYGYELETPTSTTTYGSDYGSQYRAEQGASGRMGYYEVPGVQYSEGFVAPLPLWT